MSIKKFNLITWCFLFASLITSITHAATHEPLTMDQGFKFTAKVGDSQTVITEWQMAPGYFLYRNHLKISTTTPGAKLGEPILPKGIIKTEEGFGSFEVYQNKVSVPVPIINSPTKTLNLKVSYQGCSEEGYCYPPTEKIVSLDLSNAPIATNNSTTQPISKNLPDTSGIIPVNQAIAVPLSEQDRATALLRSGSYFTIILSFLGFGVLLAFTPCVLPMVPILSGIIVGQKRDRLTTGKAFSLSLTYVLSMSFTYAIAGVLIGFVGGSIQAAFQKPWLLITFSLFFVVLSLSFFGFYELQLPQRLQNSLAKISHRQRSGNYIGVAIMGCIATLIVSPCVTPALVGALGYIGKTGNAFLGGAALFALGFGMGLPLLLIGTAGGKFLPKAGPWMNRIKSIFGVILLAMAIWIVARILPGPLVLILLACLLIVTAMFMGLFSHLPHSNLSSINRGFAVIFLVYGVTLIVGATMGNSNPFEPLHFASDSYNVALEDTSFKHVTDIKDLNSAMEDAQSQNKLVMLDFYAKWCTACKIMEHKTFSNPEVMKVLGKFVTLKADVTDNDLVAKKLQNKYQVIAPPTFIFFDSTGKELSEFRIVGEMGPKQFLEHLKTVLKQQMD